MSRLAREELVHFERVAQGAGGARRAFSRAAVGELCGRAVRRGPHRRARARKVDELLCCALIEARSHERFVRLGAALPPKEARLAEFYGELAEAEARHGEIYVELADEAAGGAGAVASCGAARRAGRRRGRGSSARAGQPTRMHAGG